MTLVESVSGFFAVVRSSTCPNGDAKFQEWWMFLHWNNQASATLRKTVLQNEMGNYTEKDREGFYKMSEIDTKRKHWGKEETEHWEDGD